MKYLIENDIPGKAKNTGEYLMGKLQDLKKKYPFIVEVRGRGLLIAVQFDSEIAQAVVMACLEKGLLVNKLKPNAIRVIPPLIISNKDVDKAAAILDAVLSGIVR